MDESRPDPLFDVENIVFDVDNISNNNLPVVWRNALILPDVVGRSVLFILVILLIIVGLIVSLTDFTFGES